MTWNGLTEVLAGYGLTALTFAVLYLLGWRLEWKLLSQKIEGGKTIETYGLRPRRIRRPRVR